MGIRTKHTAVNESPPGACAAVRVSFPTNIADEQLPPALARLAVENYLVGGQKLERPSGFSSPLLDTPAGCFVCIKTAARKLRGCIGTIAPLKETLFEEIVTNAISAATHDPRFPPISAAELTQLFYTVDVLGRPEPADLEDLDPSEFGVIVEDNTGARRGLLLPDLEGVETPQQQVSIAARKAGMSSREPRKLYRFRVRRFREAAQTTNQPEEVA